jgi:hypothetical protein
MKIVRKTTWRDKREENHGEERATLVATIEPQKRIHLDQGLDFCVYDPESERSVPDAQD